MVTKAVPNDLTSIIASFEEELLLTDTIALYSNDSDGLAVIFIKKDNFFNLVGTEDTRRNTKKYFAWDEFVHPEDNDICSYLFLSQQVSEQIKLNIRFLKEGTSIVVLPAELKKLYPSSGNQTIVFKATLHDTKNIMSQNMLEQASENNFSSLLENARDFLYFKDLHHSFTALSQTMMGITGNLPKDEYIGLTDYDIFPKEHADIYYRLEQDILQGNVATTKQLEPYYDVNGNEGWVDSRKYPVKDKSGKIIGLCGISRDVTDEKRMEDALRLSATAFETCEAILITDAKGVILSVNHACEVLTGYSADELIGKRPNIFASGKQDLQFYEAMWKTLINEGFWSGELINKRKNGEEYTEKLSITASKSPAGKTVNYIGVFSDISEKVELERQLRHSQKMESIGVLVGGIAHEFNNMLAVITVNLYLAKMKVEKECAIREKLDTAEKTCFKAAGLIKQLLVFARKDFAGNELTMVDMAEWLPEGVNLARSALSSGVELKCTIEKNDLIIKADTTELQQIVMNLINNARDASSHRDHPLIEIELSSGIASAEFRQRHKTFQGYEFVCLMLRDNGEGISHDKLLRIFEPFYTTKEVGKGTGLGMAVIEGIVHSMHGCIEVASEVGVGTTFNVYIPRLHSKTNADEANIQKAVPEKLLQGHGETILIADDAAEVLSMIAEVLHGLGYKVITACNGRDAVEQFKRNSQNIDMALLDVVMPELSGPSAAILMKEINPDLPLLFLTGYTPEERRSDMDKLENYDVVAKPISVDALSLMIRKLLD